MAGSVVQQSASQSFNNVSGAQNFSMPANFTAGNSAVVEIACFQASSARVSGVTVNGVAASLLYRETAAGVASTEVWLARNLTGGSASVTVTPSAGSGFFINACCVETTALSSAVDRSATASSSGTSITFTTGTATVSTDQLVVSLWRDDTGITNTASPSAQSPLTQGFYQTDGVNNLGGASGHKVVSSTGIQTATFANSPTTLRFGVIVTIPFALPITGSVATTASGTLAKVLALALVGSAATASVGTLSPGGGVSVNLTGSSATASAGTVSPSGAVSVNLSGSAATLANGTLTLSKALPLTGNAATATAGALGSGGGALGGNTFLGLLDSSSTNPAVTSPNTTQATGSSFLTFQGGYTNNNSTPTDTYTNTWPLLDTQVYLGYSGVFNFKIYTAQNGSGGTSHTLTINKNGTSDGEIVTGPIRSQGRFQAIELVGRLSDLRHIGYVQQSVTVTRILRR
jgi:hypothetical protein